MGCGGAATNTANNAASVKPSVSQTQTPVNTPAPAATESAVSGLASLKASDGKMATDIGLWENKDVAPRLEKLMGSDFADLKKYWNTQTAIAVEGDILKLTGCEAHNCGPNQYVMFIDTAKDNINVYHFKDGKEKAYKEKGDITLPKGFADELATFRSNSK